MARKNPFLYYGSAPGRLGFPENLTGYEESVRGLRTPRRNPLRPQGPFDEPRVITEWWPPPSWFMAKIKKSHSSKTEWLVYRCAMLILGPEGDGGWGFQVSANGGRVRGGSVIDIAITDQDPPIAIRVVSERHHIAVDASKRASDLQQRYYLERQGWKVIDIYEELILPTKYNGTQAMFWFRKALAHIEAPSPAASRSSSARS